MLTYLLRKTIKWSPVWLSFVCALWLLSLLCKPVGSVRYLKANYRNENEQRYQARFTLSPSGRYLLSIYQRRDGNERRSFDIFDLKNDQLVFSETPFSNSMHRFTPHDELYFVRETTQSGFINPRLQLLRWKPGLVQAEVLCEQEAHRMKGFFTDSEPWELHDLTHNHLCHGDFGSDPRNFNSLISPDGARWLTFENDEEGVRLALFDTKTRQRLSSYLLEGDRNTVDACFSHDSKVLLIQRSNEEENLAAIAVTLYWIDGSSGQIEQHFKWAVETELGQVCLMEGATKSITALSLYPTGRYSGNAGNMLQLLNLDGNYQAYIMKEAIPELYEQSWFGQAESIVSIHANVIGQVDHTRQELIYFWLINQSSKRGVGKSSFLPGSSFAVRDLKTGKLMAKHDLPGRVRDKFDVGPDNWVFGAVLPGAVLVLFNYDVEIFSRRNTWLDKLRDKLSRWLPADIMEPQSYLCFFNAHTGAMTEKLSASRYISLVQLNQTNDMLHVIGRDNSETPGIIHATYPYPLHKPWGWILAVAGILSVCVLALQGLLLLATRRKVTTT